MKKIRRNKTGWWLALAAAVIALGVILFVRYRSESETATLTASGIATSTASETATTTPQVSETADASGKTDNIQTDFYQIKAETPKEAWDKDGLMAKFVQDRVAQKEEAWRTGGSVYEAEKKAEAEYPDRPKMAYTLDISYKKFASKTLGTVSYLFMIDEYAGGANGLETVKTFTFGPSGQVRIGDVLDLAGSSPLPRDISRSLPNNISLASFLLDMAKADKSKFPDISQTRAGLGLDCLSADGLAVDKSKCPKGFDIDADFQNFVATDKGLSFYFDQEAVSTHAAGIVHLDAGWGDLELYLAKKTEVSLPAGYSETSYKVATTSQSSCLNDSDCQTPPEYLIRSDCPYTSRCLNGNCAVICPSYTGK